mgnify:CR=1 FL=1
MDVDARLDRWQRAGPLSGEAGRFPAGDEARAIRSGLCAACLLCNDPLQQQLLRRARAVDRGAHDPARVAGTLSDRIEVREAECHEALAVARDPMDADAVQRLTQRLEGIEQVTEMREVFSANRP